MKIGIIGGTGLYEMAGLEKIETLHLGTPFGAPSDDYVHGRLAGRDVFFLPRHGRGHRFLPSEVNHRANIFGFKTLGVDRILSVSAVGSLREDFRPRDIVLPDQYLDRTKASERHTFFGRGVVAHIAFADPVCPVLRGHLAALARDVSAARPETAGVRVHDGATYVNMEGPAFSTRAESNIYRKLECDVIGMTSLGEAKLCREAEIAYACLAMVTDYDCWREGEPSVTIQVIIETLHANVQLAQDIVRAVIERLPEELHSPAEHALAHAFLTAPDAVPPDVKKALAPLIGKYIR